MQAVEKHPGNTNVPKYRHDWLFKAQDTMMKNYNQSKLKAGALGHGTRNNKKKRSHESALKRQGEHTLAHAK